ncbi:hypothetical protein ACFLR1_03920 [Bacteroidota bacterium]
MHHQDFQAVVNDGSCIEVRDKFLGKFSVSSDCFGKNYTREITSGEERFGVVISNLADTLGQVEAWVSGLNITIDSQTISSNIIIEGAGVYETEDVIALSYRIRDSRSGKEILYDCLERCVKL